MLNKKINLETVEAQPKKILTVEAQPKNSPKLNLRLNQKSKPKT
jgi:hypothetical protein